VPAARVKLLPLPVVQVLPLSVLYSQRAPVSRPLTVIAPLLLVPSLALLPVSLVRANVGADGVLAS